MIGTTIKIKPEHQKAIETARDLHQDALIGYELAVIQCRRTSDDVYKLIRELVPEIEGFRIQFASDGEVVVIGRELKKEDG